MSVFDFDEFLICYILDQKGRRRKAKEEEKEERVRTGVGGLKENERKGRRKVM